MSFTHRELLYSFCCYLFFHLTLVPGEYITWTSGSTSGDSSDRGSERHSWKLYGCRDSKCSDGIIHFLGGYIDSYTHLYLNLSTETWTELPDLPFAIEIQNQITFNDSIYFVNNDDSQFYKLTLDYDTFNISYSTLQSSSIIGFDTRQSCSVYFNTDNGNNNNNNNNTNYILFVGGADGGTSNKAALYNIDFNSWDSNVPYLNTARFGMACEIINNDTHAIVYVFGGRMGGSYTTSPFYSSIEKMVITLSS